MKFWEGKEDWKAWRLIYPHEGLIACFVFLGALAVIIHLHVFYGTDRYMNAMLGG